MGKLNRKYNLEIFRRGKDSPHVFIKLKLTLCTNDYKTDKINTQREFIENSQSTSSKFQRIRKESRQKDKEKKVILSFWSRSFLKSYEDRLNVLFICLNQMFSSNEFELVIVGSYWTGSWTVRLLGDVLFKWLPLDAQSTLRQLYLIKLNSIVLWRQLKHRLAKVDV